jgi:hypothetical protein
VIHERLVASYGFPGNYQRAKMFLAVARPRIAAEVAATDDNPLTAVSAACTRSTWSSAIHGTRSAFHPLDGSGHVLGLPRRSFAHFGGVPGSIVYDRTKTVIRHHVAPGLAVPLHPEAAAFADHYRFTIDVLAAYRPTGKGRVERQVSTVARLETGAGLVHLPATSSPSSYRCYGDRPSPIARRGWMPAFGHGGQGGQQRGLGRNCV